MNDIPGTLDDNDIGGDDGPAANTVLYFYSSHKLLFLTFCAS